MGELLMNILNSNPELNIELELPFYLKSTGYSNSTPKQEFPCGHSQHNLIIILSGKCTLKAGAHTYRLEKNTAFLIRSNTPFSYYGVGDPCSIQWVIFDGYATIPLFLQLGLEEYMIFRSIDCASLSRVLSEMYLTSIKTDLVSKLQNSAMIYKLLIDIYTQFYKTQENPNKHKDNYTFLLAKQFIEQFYGSSITQAQIANETGITPQHLCRLFKKHLNMTPIQYLTHIRIDKAKYLLQATKLPINKIGDKVGNALYCLLMANIS